MKHTASTGVIVSTVIGGLFVVLLVVVLAIQWPGLRERYAARPQIDEVDTSDWLTFDELIHGLPLKFIYPKNWMVVRLSDEQAGIALRSPNFEPISLGGVVMSSGEIYINVGKNLDGKSAADYFLNAPDGTGWWFKDHPNRSFNRNGAEITQFEPFSETSDLPTREVYFINKNLVMTSLDVIYERIDQKPSQDVIDAILWSLIGS